MTAFSSEYFVEIDRPGVHRVEYDALREVPGQIPQDAFPHVSRGGVRQPVWVQDRDKDGLFGNGDALVIALHPARPGAVEWERFPTTLRVAWESREEGEEPWLGVDHETMRSGDTANEEVLFVYETIEESPLRIPIPDHNEADLSTSFWARLSSLDEKPFSIPVSRSPFWNLIDTGAVNLRIRVHGVTWISEPSETVPEHALVCEIGSIKARREWSSRSGRTLEFPQLALSKSEATLHLQVPERYLNDGKTFLADLSLLDWVEWSAPFLPRFLTETHPSTPLRRELRLKSSGAADIVLDLPESSFEWELYDDLGQRWRFPKSGGTFIVQAPESERFLLDCEDPDQLPVRIRKSNAVALSDFTLESSDYLLISPSSLRAGAEDLASIHQKRGIPCSVLVLPQIADMFGHGRISAVAVKSAISHWYQQQTGIKNPMVLLIGDASWEEPGTGRNIIPTWSAKLGDSYCASDHPYACLPDDSVIPNIAVGRLPVTTPSELQSYLEKVKRILNADTPSPDKPRAIFIVDHDSVNQSKARPLLTRLAESGFSTEPIFADASVDSKVRMERIHAAIKEGADSIFYYGHGARHVWRTGPPDFAAQSSLFTSADLERLAAAPETRINRLVVSLTCDNAPFDHSTDHSLGEKFITLPSGGSAAFVGSSWRVQNSVPVVEAWVEAVCDSDSVGEAFLHAKRKIATARFLQAYNLLGDPSLPLRH